MFSALFDVRQIHVRVGIKIAQFGIQNSFGLPHDTFLLLQRYDWYFNHITPFLKNRI